MTPETLINDLEKGRLDHRQVVLIIFDEAHRALSKYAYCRIVTFLQEKNVQFRVVALTATPGNSNDQVQEMITNLSIQKIVTYSLESEELQPYKKEKQIDIIKIYEEHEIKMINRELESAISLLKKEPSTVRSLFLEKIIGSNRYEEAYDPEFE